MGSEWHAKNDRRWVVYEGGRLWTTYTVDVGTIGDRRTVADEQQKAVCR